MDSALQVNIHFQLSAPVVVQVCLMTIVFAKILITRVVLIVLLGGVVQFFNAESTNGDMLLNTDEIDFEFLAGVDKNGWSFTFVVERELGNDGSLVRLRNALVLCCAPLGRA
jgi:hypothetical protein